MKKIAIAFVIIVVLIVVVGLILRACATSTDVPPVSKAPYKVQTDSSYYYAAKYIEGPDYIVLEGYWNTTDGENWHYQKNSLRLSYRGYLHPPKITKRQTSEDLFGP